jgi:multisubunit Na+/H+ antiporter MnhE subunit
MAGAIKLRSIITGGAGYFALYLAFANNVGFREVITGVLVGAVAVAGKIIFQSAGHQHFRFHWRDVLQAWRLPWCAITGTIEVLRGLAKQWFKKRGASSYLAAVAFDMGPERSPYAAGRRALAVTYTTATPNFVILGLDHEQKLMLYHQILPGKVRTMTQKLGARP